MYSFIPDSGFVGTVFVHALAHSLVSIGHHARLELQSVVQEDGVAFAVAAPAAPVVLLDDEWLVNAGHAARIGAAAGAGAQPSLVLSIGSVQSEQPLHTLVRMRLPAPAMADRVDGGELADPARTVFRAALSYRPSQGRRARVAGGSDEVTVRATVSAADAAAAFQRAGVGAPQVPLSGAALEVEAQRLRLMLINTLQRACNFMEVHDAAGATQVLDATIAHMREWLARNPEQRAGAAAGSGGGGMLARLSSLGASSAASGGAGSELAAVSASPHVRVRAMLADLTGQVTEAVSRQDWFHKWGRHYLPSLQRAHELQTCHNFKDKSVQHYGGAAFSDVRDAADDIFSNLPAPVPSGGHPPPPPMAGMAAPAAVAAAPGGGRGGYAPVNMRAYNNAGAGCVHADSLIRLADGSHVYARDVRRGMRVVGSNGSVGRVRCVMVSECADSKARLYRVGGGLRVTGWHPVRVAANGSEPAWQFPCHVGEAVDEACDAVYSFLVERALPVEGSACHDDPASFADSDALLKSDAYWDSLDASDASWPWADHVVADGVDAIALAHGIRDDAVAAHAFWGTRTVAAALRQCAGWAQGCVRFGAHSQWVQRSATASKTAAGVVQHDAVVGIDASAAMAAQ
jgi:hypothetical protein